MSSSKTGTNEARANSVRVTDAEIIVKLVDGRTIRVPVDWYPRLLHGTAGERDNCRLIGRGEGIHWPDLDEDISIDDLLTGLGSGESERSHRRWLETREPHR